MTKNTKSASGLALSGLVLKDRMRTLIAAGAAVAITATGTVVVPAVSGNGAVAYAQETGNAGDAPTPESNVKAYQDAIFSPGDANNKGTVSGSVKEIQQALVGFGAVQDTGKALKGVRVYAQWYEGVNTEHASPVYYTETDENGNFTLQFKPYVDAAGIEREFLADASVGLTTGNRDGQRDEKREKIRIWAELPADMQDQYRLVHQPAAGIFPGATTTPTTQGDGVWGGNKITGVTIQYAQKTNLPPHLPKEQWVESVGSGLYGSYQGRAFWNLNVLQGALNHNTVSAKGGSDPAAAGLTVVGSYLSDGQFKKSQSMSRLTTQVKPCAARVGLLKTSRVCKSGLTSK